MSGRRPAGENGNGRDFSEAAGCLSGGMPFLGLAGRFGMGKMPEKPQKGSKKG